MFCARSGLLVGNADAQAPTRGVDQGAGDKAFGSFFHIEKAFLPVGH
jgi:hypothetical protein